MSLAGTENIAAHSTSTGDQPATIVPDTDLDGPQSRAGFHQGHLDDEVSERVINANTFHIPLLLQNCGNGGILAVLQQLRPNRTPKLHIPTSSDDLLGRAYNIVLRVTFEEDDVVWAVRVRQQRPVQSKYNTSQVRGMSLRSEYATLRAMGGRGLPVPDVYGEDIYGRCVVFQPDSPMGDMESNS
jgi:hypothetical protein